MAYTTIDKPTDYFNTKLYTGTGATHSITNVGFQPDWVWLKRRDNAGRHRLFDAVRGATKSLRSDDTEAELTRADSLTSFDSNGFTLGADSSSGGINVNISGETMVGWSWLGANGTASNTDGSITSTVSANTTSGFSIVSYTGTGSSATVGHGLGVTPKMFIIKNRSDGTQFWPVYHASLSGANQYLVLDQNVSAQPGSAIFNSTHPTSSVFSVGGHGTTNESGDNHIAYCFAEKKGFSKAFSYTGNGNSDGVYIHLGMKPAWIMVKRTDAVNQWMIIDNKRTPSNTGTVPELFADLSDAENNSTDGRFDYLSNGLKARGTNAVINASGGSYIGFAFAESPFVTSTGIPTTAR